MATVYISPQEHKHNRQVRDQGAAHREPSGAVARWPKTVSWREIRAIVGRGSAIRNIVPLIDSGNGPGRALPLLTWSPFVAGAASLRDRIVSEHRSCRLGERACAIAQGSPATGVWNYAATAGGLSCIGER